MYKLFGIDYTNDSDEKYNTVVAAIDEKDAVKEFYKDINHVRYNTIIKITEICGNKCNMLHQLGYEIVFETEEIWELIDIHPGEGDWGDNAFSVKVKNSNNEELIFKNSLVHSDDSRLELMVCIADNKPNWIN